MIDELRFEAVWEDEPGPKWRALFERHWEHYRAWFLREGERARSSYAESFRMLETHMPELVPVYERLCDLAGHGDLEARFLSMWRQPPYLAGCSQAVWTRGEPLLVRNYDYAPDRIEGIVLGSAWGGRRVIGTSDFLWGLLDGVNDAGLAVSLAFGGRRVVGDGFGVPLVVRHLLQSCETVADARDALSALPYRLAHSLTMVDRTGAFVTAYLSPDRGVVFRDTAVATNHQDDVEWHEHAYATRSLEREQRLAVAREHAPDPESFAAAFLEPPLYSNGYAHAMGTLYTAVYRPLHGAVEYRWPGQSWEQSFDAFHEGVRVVPIAHASAA